MWQTLNIFPISSAIRGKVQGVVEIIQLIFSIPISFIFSSKNWKLFPSELYWGIKIIGIKPVINLGY